METNIPLFGDVRGGTRHSDSQSRKEENKKKREQKEGKQKREEGKFGNDYLRGR